MYEAGKWCACVVTALAFISAVYVTVMMAFLLASMVVGDVVLSQQLELLGSTMFKALIQSN